MTIDGDTRVAQSFLGSLCSLMILILTVLYAYQKMDVLIAKKDVDVLSATKPLVFTEEDKFNYDNGFNVAVAFTSYNNDEEWELDQAYGTLVFNSFEWGINPDGSLFSERKRLPSHPCSNREFGFDDEEDSS